MLVSDVLNRVNNIKPNSVSQADLISFIDDLEADIATKAFGGEGYITVDSLSQELMLPREYDRIYSEYLYAKIDLADGRTDLYSMSQSQFNQTYDEMVKHYNRIGSASNTKCRFNNYI